jgi:hypothetical protein
MGKYLNGKTAFTAYKEIKKSAYFVDKTNLIDEISKRIGIPEKYICITRPRRFGKSVMANMIGYFF